MAANFPDSPNTNDTFTSGALTFTWNGEAWKLDPSSGTKGEKGQKGEVGVTGDKGQKGQKGEVGDKGQKGEIGATGGSGGTGNAGSDGDKGQKGEIGSTGADGIPSGAIVIWSGAANAIPSGWYLCNGSNSTPDLRDKFVIGAGNSYNVGGTGGSADAVIVSHSHNHNISANTGNAGSHSHNVTGNTNNAGSHTHKRDKWGGNFGGSSGATVFRSDANGNRSTGSAGGHSHTVSGSTNNVSAHAHNVSISGNIASQGESATGKNLPPYYALCYIMKS